MISEPCPAPVTATEDDIPPKNTSTRQISMWVPKFYEKSTWTIQKTPHGPVGSNLWIRQASAWYLTSILGLSRLFESCVVPGLLLMYTQQEQPFRFGLWTITNGALPVPFLVIYYGLLSILTGILVYFFMPDNPLSAGWLNEREKAIAILDSSFQVGASTGSVTTNFIGIIIKGFGFDPLTAQLYIAPNYAVQRGKQAIVR
ncbi:hypothetical protein GQ53DRAFT_772925 [Thozetella sp. PMI_491]|nr:hypothetical protein GQ53DRAFT_772925 [Thozetella sp. PMI_491]